MKGFIRFLSGIWLRVKSRVMVLAARHGWMSEKGGGWDEMTMLTCVGDCSRAVRMLA